MARPVKNCYSTACRGTSFLWKDIVPSIEGKGNTRKEGEIPCTKSKNKGSITYQAHLNFLLHTYTWITPIFVWCLPKWSKLRYLKAEALLIAQKVQTVLVWYLLSEICLYCICAQGEVPQNFTCLSKITGYNHTEWFKNLKLGTRVHKEPFFSACKKHYFRKTKIWRQTDEDEQIYIWC